MKVRKVRSWRNLIKYFSFQYFYTWCVSLRIWIFCSKHLFVRSICHCTSCLSGNDVFEIFEISNGWKRYHCSRTPQSPLLTSLSTWLIASSRIRSTTTSCGPAITKKTRWAMRSKSGLCFVPCSRLFFATICLAHADVNQGCRAWEKRTVERGLKFGQASCTNNTMVVSF